MKETRVPSRRRTRWIIAILVIAAMVGAGVAIVALNRSGAADGPPFGLVTPLSFRPVLEAKDGSSCTSPDLRSEDGSFCYRLGEGMTVRQARQMRAEKLPDSSQWVVVITFVSADGAAFGQLSGRAAGQPYPRNQLAMVVDGVVEAAPTVTDAITGGAVQLSVGGATQQAATDFVRRFKP
ncbi:hypothetical protein ACFFMN_06190 [Planobispora siamensis]|uniref:SecDF P1 head subdomain domain-containing protein n=1 Tax=Planobispora siamensis TaxID=936338 RepID=A0A8J3SGP2_9ACTN|nr:hypothetical protein [Planobispora siamensis]GIH94226.1 hypothetical protein Psi01_48560 [Planobispora siamensis]